MARNPYKGKIDLMGITTVVHRGESIEGVYEQTEGREGGEHKRQRTKKTDGQAEGWMSEREGDNRTSGQEGVNNWTTTIYAWPQVRA